MAGKVHFWHGSFFCQKLHWICRVCVKVGGSRGSQSKGNDRKSAKARDDSLNWNYYYYTFSIRELLQFSGSEPPCTHKMSCCIYLLEDAALLRHISAHYFSFIYICQVVLTLWSVFCLLKICPSCTESIVNTQCVGKNTLAPNRITMIAYKLSQDSLLKSRYPTYVLKSWVQSS